MSFLERQESARLRSRLYTLQFVLLAIPCVAAVFVATFFSVWLLASAFLMKLLAVNHTEAELDALMTSPAYLLTSGSICTATVLGSLIWFKRRQLQRSARYVSDKLLATPVTRSTADEGARRLYNIGAEMALAAGLTPPAIYLWHEKRVVNSLTVGWNSADAAIFVTRGAIDALTRDELQALVGHGMSQILNGDMALNVRLGAYLYAFNFAPRVAKWWLLAPFDHKGLDFIKTLIVWLFIMVWIGLALSIVTFPAYLAARLLQAAVGRERQKLADASALQFTRNPEGVKGALLKALVLGSAPENPPAILDDLAHGCFASPVKRRVLATHPPLLARIRALDPRFDESQVAETRRRLAAASARPDDGREEQRESNAQRAQPTERASVSAGLPLMELGASGDPRAVLLALLMERKPEIQTLQLDVVRKRFGDSSMVAMAQALRALRPLAPEERTLALDTHLPALRMVPSAELQRLAAVIVELEATDDATDAFEYAIARRAHVFIKDWLEPRQPHGGHGLESRAAALGTTLSILAQHGGGARRDAALAYAIGIDRLPLPDKPRFSPHLQSVRPLDAALEDLQTLRPIDKAALIEAMQATVEFDGTRTPLERELVRTIAASLHCPLPRNG